MSDQPNTYTYEAFISYRHNPRDSLIAKTISERTEGYRIPTSKLRSELGKKKIGRLFRDEDELPFGGVINDAISDAIRSSRRFIMLLCPDYLDENHWCIYELAEFLKTHHYRDVVVVVSSGDIAELTKQTSEIIRNKGLHFYDDVDLTGRPVDPFAVELSAYFDEKELKKALISKRLKIIAGILDIDYDDLNRRERRRQIRRRWAILTPVITVVSAFAIVVSFLAYNINLQKNEIEIQKNDIEAQKNTIETQKTVAQKNEISLLLESSKNAAVNGDRLAGMRYALDSYAIYDEVYADGDTETLQTIKQALEGSVYFGNLQLLAPIKSGNRRFGGMEFSPNDRYILGMLGYYNDAVLIDARSGDILYTINRVRPYGDYALTFHSFSPSGEYFVTGFGVYSCEIVIWRTGDTPAEITSFDVSENHIDGRFLSENEIIFCASPGFFEENDVRIWNFETDVTRTPTEAEIDDYRKRSLEEMENQFYDGELSAKYSADGSVRYESWGVGSDKGILCYDAASGKAIGEITVADTVLALSHDNNRLVAGNGNGFLGIYSTPQSSDVSIQSADVSSQDPNQGSNQGSQSESAHGLNEGSGSGLGQGSNQDSVQSNPATGSLKIYAYPTNVIPDLSDLPDSLKSNHYINTEIYPYPSITWCRDPSERFLGHVYPDFHVDVWDMKQDEEYPIYGLQEHLSGVVGIFMTKKYMITAGWDGKIILVDIYSGILNKCIIAPESIAAINLDPSGNRAIVLATDLKCAYVYDLESGIMLLRLDAGPGEELNYDGRNISAIGFTANGEKAVAIKKSGERVIGTILVSLDDLIARANRTVG